MVAMEFAEVAQVAEQSQEISPGSEMPPNALGYWQEHKADLEGSPKVVVLFESPDGLAVVH